MNRDGKIRRVVFLAANEAWETIFWLSSGLTWKTETFVDSVPAEGAGGCGGRWGGVNFCVRSTPLQGFGVRNHSVLGQRRFTGPWVKTGWYKLAAPQQWLQTRGAKTKWADSLVMRGTWNSIPAASPIATLCRCQTCARSHRHRHLYGIDIQSPVMPPLWDAEQA